MNEKASTPERTRAETRGRTPPPLPVLSGLDPVAASLLDLQSAVGNQATSRLIRGSLGLVQPKLRIGPPGDFYEREADRVADAVLHGPAAPVAVSAVSGSVQRCARCQGECGCHEAEKLVQPQEAPGGTSPVTAGFESRVSALRGGGEPLPSSARSFFEPRFGLDLEAVRVHIGNAADDAAQAVNARAFTVGNDIVFGAGEYSPETSSGRHLLAHELTHVVQQNAGASRVAPTLRAKPKPQPKAPPKKPIPKISQICGRASRKVAGNFITRVTIDVGTNKLTIQWKDKTKVPPGSSGKHSISPGAGLCCVNCNNAKVSQTTGSLCTPKGGQWAVSHTGCELGGHPTAKNPTYFQRKGVAIHSGNTASAPRSHGCARTSLEISELIHDNVKRGVTKIASDGIWTSTKCYLKESSKDLTRRKDVCDGNKLKSTKKDKTPKGKPQPQTPKPALPRKPVAAVLPEEESNMLATVEELEPGTERQPEMVADGPGPNNEPVSHESIGEMPVAGSDLIEDAGEEGDLEDETVIV